MGCNLQPPWAPRGAAATARTLLASSEQGPRGQGLHEAPQIAGNSRWKTAPMLPLETRWFVSLRRQGETFRKHLQVTPTYPAPARSSDAASKAQGKGQFDLEADGTRPVPAATSDFRGALSRCRQHVTLPPGDPPVHPQSCSACRSGGGVTDSTWPPGARPESRPRLREAAPRSPLPVLAGNFRQLFPR